MTDQDRAAQVWKGPYKCRECGNVFHGIVLETAKKERWHFTTFSGPHEECTGELEPYDRRNPSQAAYGQEWYRAGVEDSYEAARKAWPMALRECQANEILDAIYNLLAEQEKK